MGDAGGLAAQVAGVADLGRRRARQRDALEGVADLGQAVDPDAVVEFGQRRCGVLALPFPGELPRFVHHVAQAEHQAAALGLEHGERLFDLAAQAERLLVDQENVGAEGARGVLEDGGADGERLVEADVEAVRLVVAVLQLDDAGDAHEIDPLAEAEAADDRRAGQDQHGDVRAMADEGVRDGPAAAQVAQAEAVVAVDQNAEAGVLALHTVPLADRPRPKPRAAKPRLQSTRLSRINRRPR